MMKKLLVFFGFAAAFACIAADALAQGATPMPIDKATVSTDVAKRTLVKAQISAPVARQLVDACLEFARNQQGGPGTYAIYVLAPNGDIVDAHVMDGVLPIGAETGLLKAKTALYARSSSSAVAQSGSGTVDGRLIRLRPRQAKSAWYYFVGGTADRRRRSVDRRYRRGRRQSGRDVRLPPR
jgi:uncharacterized protein GlcG (DUF336 family)